MIPIHAYLHIHILSPDTKEKNLLLPFHACAISSIADFGLRVGEDRTFLAFLTSFFFTKISNLKQENNLGQ